MSTAGKFVLIVVAAVMIAVAAFAGGSLVGGSGDNDDTSATQPSVTPSDLPSSQSPSPSGTGGTSVSLQKPFTVGLKGTGNTSPFNLRGGDYRIDWTTSGDCDYSVEMVPTIVSSGAQDLITADKATSGGEVLRDVNAGAYFVEGVSDPPDACAWEVTFTHVKPN